MNVLIFVMSMLMIFVLMTYARIDTYRSMAGVEGEFIRYIESIERAYINLSADKIYNKVKFSYQEATPPVQTDNQTSATSNDGETQPKKKGKGNKFGRISVKLLIDAKAREEKEKEFQEVSQLLKNLIKTLFGPLKSFQTLLHDHPAMIDDIIEKIPIAVTALPENIKIKRASDLSNLNLGGDLDDIFYFMLKGCPRSGPGQKKDSNVAIPNEDNADDSEEANEYTSERSYDSLLNFIDLHQSNLINIYIARKPVLMAIYQDPRIVENIIQKRNELYKAVSHKEMTYEEASEKLKSAFQIGNDDNLIEYTVTGSNPENYN